MFGLYAAAVTLTVISCIADRQKTVKGLQVGLKKLRMILPSYLKLLVLIAIILFFSEQLIVVYLGQENRLVGMLSGLLLGSVTVMPGFIAYPLAGVLVSKGISYMVVAAFVTSLMMVGALTYAVEKTYLGRRATLIRNGVSLMIAACIALVIGVVYGEL